MKQSYRERKQTLLYILSGEDDFSISQSLEEIKRGIGDPDLLSANTTVLDGQQLIPDQLMAVVKTVPFLAEKRLVIIKGLLGRFEPKTKSSGGKKTVSKANRQNEYKSLAACIDDIPDSTILVLVDGKVGNKNPLFKALSPRATVKTFPRLRNPELRKWIQKQVKKEAGTISSQAVDMLVRIVGSNLWIMNNEIEKLTLFTSGRLIGEEDVDRVVSYAREVSVFAVVDAILESKARIAEQALHHLLQRGAAPTHLLVMLSRQVRMIVIAKELRGQRKPETEIQNRLGLTSDYALRKTLEQANRYPVERLKRLYHKLLETDLSIKTGKYDGELALSMLIAELCQRS